MALKAFIAKHERRLGLVSAEVPLISNLSACNNIALIRQYHENLSSEEAKNHVLALLNRFGICSAAEKRNPALTREERFCVMLLRAAMVRDAIVVLDRPFRIFPDLPDGRFFIDALRRIDDLIAEVHIFDYHWEKERYGTGDDSTN